MCRSGKEKTCLVRNAQAIAYNIRLIRQRTEKRIIAVIKRDGYGTGLMWEYQQCLQAGIDFFAVSTADEALFLRSQGCTSEILLLTPADTVSDCVGLIRQRVILMLGSPRQAELLEEAGQLTGIIPRVHLKIDTGLGRFGFSWKKLGILPDLLRHVQVEGCYTHLALQRSNWKHQAFLQKRRFDRALFELKSMGISVGMTHVAASKAFAGLGDLGYDGIRIGSLLLGRPGCVCREPYEDAVCLQTSVCDTIWREKGSTVGYDASWKLKKDTLVGLVPVGCSDGIFLETKKNSIPGPRFLLSRLYHGIRKDLLTVQIDGRQVPVLGKTGMEFLLVPLDPSRQGPGTLVQIRVNPLLAASRIPRINSAITEIPCESCLHK